MRDRLRQAAEDALIRTVRFLLPVAVLLGPLSWLIIDYYQVRERANTSFFYLQAAAQRQQSQAAPTPAANPSPDSKK